MIRHDDEVEEGVAYIVEMAEAVGHDLSQVRPSQDTFAVTGIEFIGVRHLGTVSLKGLDNLEISEIVPFAPGEAEAQPFDSLEPLVAILRQDLHQRGDVPAAVDRTTTTERVVETELVVCVQPEVQDPNGEVLIGEWDPQSDNLARPIRLPRDDFRRLFSLGGTFTGEELGMRKDRVRDLYNRLLSDRTAGPSVSLGAYRNDSTYQAFVLGEVVEKL